jgi:5-methylcytosine-specific restriction endonuclease McrA
MVKKKRDPNKEINLKTYLIPKLRSISLYWPARQEAIRRCMVERGNYRCEGCGQTGFKRQELQLDHKDPVIDIQEGWQGFDVFVERLYCPASGFQCLCEVCHTIKTETEKQLRVQAKAKKKESEQG